MSYSNLGNSDANQIKDENMQNEGPNPDGFEDVGKHPLLALSLTSDYRDHTLG